jgi:hypothetical protein
MSSNDTDPSFQTFSEGKLYRLKNFVDRRTYRATFFQVSARVFDYDEFNYYNEGVAVFPNGGMRICPEDILLCVKNLPVSNGEGRFFTVRRVPIFWCKDSLFVSHYEAVAGWDFVKVGEKS